MTPDRRTVLERIGAVAATGATAGCLGGTGRLVGRGDADGEMTLWHSLGAAEAETFHAFLEQFENETGHASLIASHDDLAGAIEDATLGGYGPDTWQWAHDWIGGYAVRDTPFVYDATDALEDRGVDLGVYTDAARKAIQFDGGVYGLPISGETVALFYNRNLVDEPPDTLAEMEATMQEYYDPDAGWYGLSYPVDAYFASGYLQAFGGRLYDEGAREVGVDDDAVLEGLEVLADRLWSYTQADPNYEVQRTVFERGRAPFAINGPWEFGHFDSSPEVDLGVTTLPAPAGGDPTPYTGVQLWYFGAALADASEPVRDAVFDWAEWYTTTESVVVTLAEEHGKIPVHREHSEQADLDASVQTFADSIDAGTPIPTHPTMDQLWGPTEQALYRVFRGEQEPDPALERAATKIRERVDGGDR